VTKTLEIVEAVNERSLDKLMDAVCSMLGRTTTNIW
jgi:hypothetical protein